MIPRIRAVTRIGVSININVLPLIEGAVVDAKHIPNGPVWVDYHRRYPIFQFQGL
jgi:hypothetical protein